MRYKCATNALQKLQKALYFSIFRAVVKYLTIYKGTKDQKDTKRQTNNLTSRRLHERQMFDI